MPRLIGSTLLRGSSPPAIEQVSTYFDTNGQRLRKAGLTLRLRHANGRWRQTVKAEGRAGALFDRLEWESDVDGPAIDMAALAATPVPAVLGPRHGPAALKVQFRPTVTRRTWRIDEGEDAVELILDQGEIEADGKRDPVCEIELELLRGSPALMFGLARSIDAAVPIRIGIRSKSERGFRLLDGVDDGPIKAEPVRLDGSMSVPHAFQAIVWNCIRQFRANEPLLLRTGDPGALHQARVGLRRLRSAFSLFGPIVGGPEAESIRAELRWIAALLGGARDLDVLLEDHVRADDVERRTALARQRNAAFSRAVAALESSRFRTLMIELARWLTIGDWHRGEPAARPIAEVAAATLDRFRRKLKRAAGEDLALLDDEGRHEVRIVAKKLRYGTEFFAGLHAEGKAKRQRAAFLGALVALQETLGALNDLATARGFAMPGDDPSRWDARREELIARAQARLIQLMDAKPFWR